MLCSVRELTTTSNYYSQYLKWWKSIFNFTAISSHWILTGLS